MCPSFLRRNLTSAVVPGRRFQGGNPMKTILYRCLCLAVLTSGCQSIQSMTSSKPKADGHAEPVKVSSASSAGADETPPQKPVNPLKVHLAYAAWHEQSGNYKEAHDSYMKV